MHFAFICKYVCHSFSFKLIVQASDLIVLVLQMRTPLDVSSPGLFLWISDWTCCLRTPLCGVSLLGYFAGEFQAFWLSLWCLVPWISHLLHVCWSNFWKSSLKWYMVCKFDIMEDIFIVFIMFYIYLNASHYDNNIISFTLFSYLKRVFYVFCIYFSTLNLHRRSDDTFN